jgi:hypothetical protein
LDGTPSVRKRMVRLAVAAGGGADALGAVEDVEAERERLVEVGVAGGAERGDLVGEVGDGAGVGGQHRVGHALEGVGVGGEGDDVDVVVDGERGEHGGGGVLHER